MKAVTALVILAVIALTESALAAPQAVTLIAHNQRSSSGTRSTLVWKECTPSTNLAPCIASPIPQWNIDNNVMGSDVMWTWDPATRVLTGAGLYWVTSYINSNPRGTPVISDRVVNPVIDTQARTTTFASYDCIEGTFLAGVNASGCGNVNLGFNTILDSIAAWGVGGNQYCVTLEIFDDDYSLLDGASNPVYIPGTPNPRGGHAVNPGDPGLAPACVKTSGAFDLWTVIDSRTVPPQMIPSGYTANQLLFISNGVDVIGCTLPVDINCQGANWMTFAYVGPVSDTDSDGVLDWSDNCALVLNFDQFDADGDRYGNICDADLNNTGLVTSKDYTILRNALNTNNTNADLDHSGMVTVTDYTILRNRLNTAPGPSGLCAATPVMPCTPP